MLKDGEGTAESPIARECSIPNGSSCRCGKSGTISKYEWDRFFLGMSYEELLQTDINRNVEYMNYLDSLDLN